MAKAKKNVDRRKFLRGAAGLVATSPVAFAQRAAEKPEATGGAVDVTPNVRCGADFMVDVFKSLGIEYCAANPGTSFRGLHESVINYGNNKDPEFLTCLHEESSVAMAHGYAKIEGKPMMIMAHGTVGLQHASMAIYNAYADRVPVYIVLGNLLDINYRRGSADWYHSVQDAAAMVRDYTKWDDAPVSLSHFAESAVRAYTISMTPPYEPIVIVADGSFAGRAHHRKKSAHPQTSDQRPAARRRLRRQRSRETTACRRESRHRSRPLRPHPPRHRTPGRVG